MACWCQTNDKDKTKSIAEAETRIADLTTQVEELTAGGARVGTEIKNLEKEVAANQAALDQATAIREKQLAEFNGEEKDVLESISALKAAITVLSKHHGGAFLQMPRSHVLGVATTLQREMQKHASLLQGTLTRSERKIAKAFIQAPGDYFDAAPTFKQSYAPQSGEIFGILRQMKETFEACRGVRSKSSRGIRPPCEAPEAGSGLTCTPTRSFLSSQVGCIRRAPT